MWLCLSIASCKHHGQGFCNESRKWEFTTTMTMPIFSQPQVTTMTECITEEEAKKDPMADLVDDDNCKILNKKTKGSTMTFEMECGGGSMIHAGERTVHEQGRYGLRFY